MRPAPLNTFTVMGHGRGIHLCRTSVPPSGRTYTHRCCIANYETVAHAAAEAATNGCVLEEIADTEELPFSQVAVALSFMLERGCLTTSYRRNFPASDFAFEDAMIELHALHHEGDS